jgi:hypothetical protein
MPETLPVRGAVSPLEGTLEIFTLEARGVERVVGLSGEGCLLPTRAPYPVGTILPARLRPSGTAATFAVLARVTWQNGEAMALQFLLPDASLEQALKELEMKEKATPGEYPASVVG